MIYTPEAEILQFPGESPRINTGCYSEVKSKQAAILVDFVGFFLTFKHSQNKYKHSFCDCSVNISMIMTLKMGGAWFL